MASRRPRSLRLPADVLALLRDEPLDPPDVERFVILAEQHGVIGLLDQAIQDGRWRPSDAARTAIRSLRGTNALRAALLRQELPRAAAILTDACGVAPVVIKGPVVAERLYAARTLRSFGDLDLLVPRASLRPAVEALVACGWQKARAGKTYAALGEPLPSFAEDYGHELHVMRQVGPATVHLEAHWRIGDDPLGAKLDHDRLAARARPVPELGPHLVAPAPVDELLVLAVHLLHHGSDSRLIWHVDLALARDALTADEWDEAFAIADELGLTWALHRALDRVAETVGADRARPQPAPAEPPAWGPLRAADTLPPRLAEHVGRLAPLSWRGRARYAGRIGLATGRRLNEAFAKRRTARGS